VFYETPTRPALRADVLGPPPAWLIRCPAERLPVDLHQLEATLGHRSNFIGLVETLQDQSNVGHAVTVLVTVRAMDLQPSSGHTL
jgi:hypothetical protein